MGSDHIDAAGPISVEFRRQLTRLDQGQGLADRDLTIVTAPGLVERTKM
jgi:hypothetical protein